MDSLDYDEDGWAVLDRFRSEDYMGMWEETRVERAPDGRVRIIGSGPSEALHLRRSDAVDLSALLARATA